MKVLFRVCFVYFVLLMPPLDAAYGQDIGVVTVIDNCSALRVPDGTMRPCVDKIAQQITSFENYIIFVFIYQLTNAQISNAISEVLARDEDVRPVVVIIADQRSVNEVRSDGPTQTNTNFTNLVNQGAIGLELVGVGRIGSMHNKMLIVVKNRQINGQDTWVAMYATGSLNFSNNAAQSNWENFIFLETFSPQILRDLTPGFDNPLFGEPVIGPVREALSGIALTEQLLNFEPTLCTETELSSTIMHAENLLDGAVAVSVDCMGLATR